LLMCWLGVSNRGRLQRKPRKPRIEGLVKDDEL
jgi:hypothetical protein